MMEKVEEVTVERQIYDKIMIKLLVLFQKFTLT